MPRAYSPHHRIDRPDRRFQPYGLVTEGHQVPFVFSNGLKAATHTRLDLQPGVH